MPKLTSSKNFFVLFSYLAVSNDLKVFLETFKMSGASSVLVLLIYGIVSVLALLLSPQVPYNTTIPSLAFPIK